MIEYDPSKILAVLVCLRLRVLAWGAWKIETDELHFADVAAAERGDCQTVFVDDVMLMMRFPFYRNKSLFSCEIEAKRFEFARDYYLAHLPRCAPLSRRQLAAAISFICTACWAKLGRKWMEATMQGSEDFSWWRKINELEANPDLVLYIKRLYSLPLSSVLPLVNAPSSVSIQPKPL